MLKKLRQTQFFEHFVYSGNRLTLNVLCITLSFLSPKVIKNPFNFQFLFRRTSKTVNYTLLNISAELRRLFFRFPVPFQKLCAENFSKLLSF